MKYERGARFLRLLYLGQNSYKPDAYMIESIFRIALERV